MAEATDIMVVDKGSTGSLVESWIFATSGRDFSIYSERLILRLVQLAQQQLLGVSFKDGTAVGQVTIGPLGEAKLQIPIKSLMGEDTAQSNYSKARKAVMELMSAPYFVERPKMSRGKPVLDEDGKPEFEFRGRQILNSVDINVTPGAAIIEVNRDTWDAILSFSKGFRKYELDTALKLKLTSSLRIYKLLSNQEAPITFSIDQLRALWKMDERDPKTGEYLRYKNTSDFIRRNIAPAKEELDRKSPWTFEWVENRARFNEANAAGKKGAKSITSITFFPKHRISMESLPKVLRIASSALDELGRENYDLLVNKFEFSPKGLKNNLELFYLVRKSGMDLAWFLNLIAPNALRAENPQGYVISSIRAFLTEQYGYRFDSHGKVIDEGE